MMKQMYLAKVKCGNCPTTVDCKGMSEKETHTAMHSTIQACVNKHRTDHMECGIKKNLRLFTNFTQRQIPRLLEHHKAQAEEDALEKIDEINERIAKVLGDTANDSIPWEIDSNFCGNFSMRSCNIMRNDGIKILGPVKDDALELEIPNPIRILVSKKGQITVLDDE